jgi:Fibrinogen beta and gamma chains, C-terminal globular domain
MFFFREINLQLKSLPTKQYLSSAVAGVKRLPPTYAMIGNTGENAESSNFTVPPTCKELPSRKSGVYKISANYLLKSPFYAFCEMVMHEGGWTVIQTRLDGTVNFFKGWAEYKHGFGNIGGEYWIGLDKLHAVSWPRFGAET